MPLLNYHTIPFAIVTSGNGRAQKPRDNVAFRKISSSQIGEALKPFDVARFLKKDPHAGGVRHIENGSTAVTQVACFQQPNFVKVVKECCTKVVETVLDEFVNKGDTRGVMDWYTCLRGVHRSDTIGREVTEQTNSLVWPDGTRLFWTCHFPFSEAVGDNGIDVMIEESLAWTQEPWGEPRGGRDLLLNERYAYDNCMRHRDAYAARKELHMFTEELNRMIEDAVERLKERPALLAAAKKKLNKTCANPPGVVEPPWKRKRDDSADADDDAGASDFEATFDTHASRKRSSHPPDWATFENDVTSYWELLDEFGVDETARNALFHLAKLGEEGHRLAMAVIGKLQNNKNTGKIRNPSEFVHKCSCNAITTVHREYKGGGSSSQSKW